MMSVVRESEGLAEFTPKEGKVREFRTDKNEGAKNTKTLADFICEMPLPSWSVPSAPFAVWSPSDLVPIQSDKGIKIFLPLSPIWAAL